MKQKKAEPAASVGAALARVEPSTGELSAPIELAPRPVHPSYLTSPAGEDFGLVAVGAQAAAILQADLVDDEVDVLPTGEVYLSQIGYRRRLNAAFGPGSWAMVPDGDPVQMGTSLAQRWHLYVLGKRVSVAYGEAEYHESNPRQTWATAWESAKSNGLMRLCKDLGVASECWDRRWTEAFKKRCCVRVWRKGSNKPEWRRADAPPFFDESGLAADAPVVRDDRPVEGARATPSAAPPRFMDPPAGVTPAAPPSNGNYDKATDTRVISEPQAKRLFAIAKGREKALGVEVLPSLKDHLLEQYGLDHSRDIQRKDYEAIVAWVEAFAVAGEPDSDDVFGARDADGPEY